MDTLSRKIVVALDFPVNGDITGDRERLIAAVSFDHHPVNLHYSVFKKYYKICRESHWHFTVTLIWTKDAWEIIRLEPGDTTDTHYGLAVDLGSTTVIMQVVDLNNGHVIDEHRTFNQQITFGDEILSRIFYTKNSPDHLATLQKSTLDTFYELLNHIEVKTGLTPENFGIMIVSGNTTMLHFLLGFDPWSIFEAPFIPVFNGMDFFRASDLSLPFSGIVYCVPSVANYLGGDILSGLLTTKLYDHNDISLFIDIGTNGEMVLGNCDFLLSGAGAAGPALEGGISQSGMKAGPGAIDHIEIKAGTLHYSTIGNKKPLGICGSGIVDLLSEMLLNGWIDFGGFYIPEASDRIVKIEEGYALIYVSSEESADHKPLLFTQNDIKQYLDTKAAAGTMITYLLEAAAISMEEVKHLYIAGAFCEHIRLESAITIGLYPDLPRERFTILGNSSLNGARALLLDRTQLTVVEKLQNNLHYLEFGAASDFLTRMYAARFLPHTDIKQYPSVQKKLREKGILK